MLNNYFEKIYCINLEKRKDRWNEVSKEFQKINCNVEKFVAIDGEKLEASAYIYRGELGCYMSHMVILKDMINNNYSKILVFEDDVVFNDDFNAKFDYYYNQLPNDWDIVYMSGNHTTSLEKITDNIYKTNGTLAMHSYFISLEGAKKLYNLLVAKNMTDPIDVIGIEYQKNNNCYTFRPHLTYQKEGFSDIQKKVVNYDHLLKR
jgi:glycosyl transferase family 25